MGKCPRPIQTATVRVDGSGDEVDPVKCGPRDAVVQAVVRDVRIAAHAGWGVYINHLEACRLEDRLGHAVALFELLPVVRNTAALQVRLGRLDTRERREVAACVAVGMTERRVAEEQPCPRSGVRLHVSCCSLEVLRIEPPREAVPRPVGTRVEDDDVVIGH